MSPALTWHAPCPWRVARLHRISRHGRFPAGRKRCLLGQVRRSSSIERDLSAIDTLTVALALAASPARDTADRRAVRMQWSGESKSRTL